MSSSDIRPGFRADGINWIGVWTLYRREVRRFLAVFAQTIGGPAVTTLLFLAVFGVVMAGRSQSGTGVPYLEFLAPGLIAMTMAQNAFANTSSSILIAKVQGNIADILMAPLSPAEFVIGFALGGVTRGLLVGMVVTLTMWPFVDFGVEHAGFVVFHALAACLMLSLLGIIGGLWAQKMDHLGAITSFVVTPLTFLSGTFYLVRDLPPAFQAVAYGNPFFYMIDGFRYGMTGQADGSPLVGLLVVAAANALLGWAAYRLVESGWRLQS